MKVSVIVPVYNPGDHIDDLIASLLGQSLPSSEYEAIFVDDGSTDGTGERLDALAAEHAHVRVEHIPNSGWPSRPRNVGLDLAQGEFVLFADNDDWLGREALERLYDRAIADDADVVIGKVVGHRKSVPRVLFAKNRREVPLDWGPLWGLLSPHKLFRRALLDEHGIRFPEDRRRLEDHAFVVPAYFRARRISILADYPVYHWVLRDQEVNASTRAFAVGEYFASVERVLDLIVEHTEPGRFRDWLLAHWYRGKLLGRVGGTRFLERDPEVRQEIYDAVRALAAARFAPSADEFLPLNFKVRAQLLRADRLDGLMELARVESTLRVEGVVQDVRPEDGAVVVEAESRVLSDDGPLLFRRGEDGIVVWVAPARLEPFLEAPLDATEATAKSSARMVLRAVNERSEYVLPAKTTAELRPSEDHPGALELVFRSTTRVDPAKAAVGKPLPVGGWHVRIDCRVGGFRAANTVWRKARWGPLTLAVRPDGTIEEWRRSIPSRVAHYLPFLVTAYRRVRPQPEPTFSDS